MSRFPLLPAAASMLAIALPLTACASSSPPPPVVEVRTVRILPPAGLMADIPPPDIPEAMASRDELDGLMVALAGWGQQLRQRLSGLRGWAAEPPPADPAP